MANQNDRSPNDQRSDVMNPNNGDYQHDQDNRSNQLNPNHQPSKSDDHPMRDSGQDQPPRS